MKMFLKAHEVLQCMTSGTLILHFTSPKSHEKVLSMQRISRASKVLEGLLDYGKEIKILTS